MFKGFRRFRFYTEEVETGDYYRGETTLVVEHDRLYGAWCDVFKAVLNRRQRRQVEKDLRMDKKERQTLPFRIRIDRGYPPGLDL